MGLQRKNEWVGTGRPTLKIRVYLRHPRSICEPVGNITGEICVCAICHLRLALFYG